MALAPGTLIGNRYAVISKLGDGTYGDVYRARDTHQQLEVAVKLMKHNYGPTWQEAQVLSELESDYILRIRNAALDSGVPFLVTDIAEHGAADVAMNPIGVDPENAVRWTRHACRGAARTHAARLIHRDIKPGNLFLTGSGGAQLGDFGLAELMDANEEAAPLGTPATKAPEVAAGNNTTVRSDVYSLGATLYALLVGQYAASIGDMPVRDAARHVSRALAGHVHKAMSDTPADRFADAAAFDAALGSLPIQSRAWRRTDEHAPAHLYCACGHTVGKQDVTICLVPTTGKRAEVVAMHAASRRRVTAACRGEAPPSQHDRNIRAAIAAAS